MNNHINKIDAKKLLAYHDNFADIKDIKTICIKENKIKKPLYSIVIPTYQRTVLLEQAIDSALNQKADIIYEIVIVDNDPTRNCSTEKLINSKYSNEHKISYYKNEKNIGMFNNWNRCGELIQSDWMCMLHDDDLVHRNYISVVHKYLSKSSDTCLLGNRATCVYKKYSNSMLGKTVINLTAGFNKIFLWLFRGNVITLNIYDFIFNNPLSPAGFVLCKSTFIKQGGFNGNCFSEDTVLFIKIFLSHSHKVKVVNSSISTYRYLVNVSLNREVQKQFIETNFVMRDYILKSQKHIKLINMLNCLNLFVYNCRKSKPTGMKKILYIIFNVSLAFFVFFKRGIEIE